MDRQFGLTVLLLIVTAAACHSVPTQPPPGSTASPYPDPNLPAVASQAAQSAQITGSQRLQYAWNKAMDGVAMGAIAGPYGMGGGFVIGLIAGLMMADSHYIAVNNQIHVEQQKNQQLEAAIEQEMTRQRELETQVSAALKSEPPAAGAGSTGTDRRAPAQSEAATIKGPSADVSPAVLKKAAAVEPRPSAFKNLEVRDLNTDGIPDVWVYYDPKRPGEITRQEEASQGDGRVDTWNYFKDRQLVRREVDSKGRGRPDIVFYYVNDKIAREERDEYGLGRITYRATYENGRLAKVEKETDRNGRIDLWVSYDTSADGEMILKEEKDLDGDGIADMWSYYTKGRLVRRDVSAVGLDILAAQEQLPISAADMRRFMSPGG